MNDYEKITSDFMEKYKHDYGELKFNKVYIKVFSSNKIGRLIQKSKERQLAPNHKDWIPLFNEIPFFLFSNADTITLGAIIAISRWNDECNSQNKLLNNYEMYLLILNIITETDKFRFKH